MDLHDQKARILLKPLYEAIKDNNFEKVNHLLTSCEDSPIIKKLLKFNQVPDKRRNPLNLALKSGSSESIIRVLLESGADPNEHVLHSPFLLAVRRKDLKSIKLFMEYGGNPFKSNNIIQTATKKKYYDEEIVNAISQFGAKMKLKGTRKRYTMLIRVISFGKRILLEAVLRHFQEISRSSYKLYVNSWNRHFRSPIPDLINSRFDYGNRTYTVSETDYKELLSLVNLIYKLMSREDRQQTLHDINHCLEWSNRRYTEIPESSYQFLDRINLDILDMVIEDLKWDFDINSIALCKGQSPINNPENQQNLLVCAFRYSNQFLAEKLIKLGTDLSLVRFEDLSLIYRLEGRDKLMRLLVAAGYRLPHNFDIHQFVSETDFGDYVCWTGTQVDYYINDKLIYLYKLYTTLVPQYQFNLQSRSRMTIIKNYHPYYLKEIIGKLPIKLQKYMSFIDCD